MLVRDNSTHHNHHTHENELNVCVRWDKHENDDENVEMFVINDDCCVLELKNEIMKRYDVDIQSYVVVLTMEESVNDGQNSVELMDSEVIAVYSNKRQFFRADENDRDDQTRASKTPALNLVMNTIPRNEGTNSNEDRPKSSKSVVKVCVSNDDDVECNIEVVVYNESDEKPFIGGFRNKVTGTEYHHADMQTLPLSTGDKGVDKFHRETQTVRVSSTSQQTVREKGTQMAGPGVYQDGVSDIVLLASSDTYVSADEVDAFRKEVTIEVQCFVRQCLAKRRLHLLKMERQHAAQQAKKEEEEKQRNEEEAQKREIDRRMHPKCKADFDLLLREVEAWRVFETEKVKCDKSLCAKEKHRRLELILHKEIKLLQTIDRLKLEASKVQQSKKLQDELRSLAAPKEWKSANDVRIQLRTPFTSRATELSELYEGLNLDDLPKNERLDLLFRVKWVAKQYGVASSREVVQLIDREADLLNRGRDPRSIDGLRRRISNRFFAFIKETIPMYNKETTRCNTSIQQHHHQQKVSA